MKYQMMKLSDQSPVGEPGPLPKELDGLIQRDLDNLSWTDSRLNNKYKGMGFVPVPDPEPEPVPTPRKISALAFKQRLTLEERIAIRTAGKSDVLIEDFLDLLSQATTVDLDHQDTVNGVNYMVARGHIEAKRIAEILS